MGFQDMQLSRRAALRGLGAFVVAVHLPLPRKALAQDAASQLEANAFIRIGSDDTVTILSKHIEFGQGPWTGLATLAAEEMDADWTRVRVEHAPANAALYANLFLGAQLTGGSSAIANSYEQMRRAGAAARLTLVRAAAKSWGVAEGGLTVENGVIRDSGGRSGRFGEFAALAAESNPVDPAAVVLKDAAQFKLIGKDRMFHRIDSPAKCNGTAMFTLDIQEPGMLTVVVAHAPRFGGKVKSFDASEARKVRGVRHVKQIPQGIAVYADGTWPALKARNLLNIEWDDSAAEGRSTGAMLDDYRAKAKEAGDEVASAGDAEGVLGKAEKVIEAEYTFPYLAHAPMEPLDGFLTWNANGAKARFGSQGQTIDQMAIANVLGLQRDQVAIETMLAGGSFGRRAQQMGQFAAELAAVAKALGPDKPVKLVWTREDDLCGGFYRPMYVHRMRGGIAGGRITGWSATIVGQSIMGGTPMASAGPDRTSTEGASEIPYDIPDFRVGLVTTESPVPVLWWRSVGHTHTGYAVECFIDELLEATGQDPVEGRLALMGKQPRAAGALKAVAALAKWTGPDAGNGRMRGVAVVESFRSFVAQIAEVSVVDGRPKLHKVYCAVDCGVAVNPDIIRAQMEGGIGYALGAVLFGEISLKDGLVQQRNFDTYRSLRIDEMPEVEVAIVPSSEAPTGVGEPGVPCLGPAMANAMARLGLGRPKRLPFNAGVV
jgi:isoquinoline 1-oxidoreductase beta subunit